MGSPERALFRDVNASRSTLRESTVSAGSDEDAPSERGPSLAGLLDELGQPNPLSPQSSTREPGRGRKRGDCGRACAGEQRGPEANIAGSVPEAVRRGGGIFMDGTVDSRGDDRVCFPYTYAYICLLSRRSLHATYRRTQCNIRHGDGCEYTTSYVLCCAGTARGCVLARSLATSQHAPVHSPPR